MNKDKILSRKVRVKIALSQEDFALKYGISVSTVRKHDQGVSVPGCLAITYYKLIEEYPDVMASMVAKVLQK